MKIVLTTWVFFPVFGGIPTVVDLLAREFVKKGHEVKVVTLTPSEKKDDYPYAVIRQPRAGELLRLFLSADLYLQQGAALKFGWPVFLGSKQAAIIHHNELEERGRKPMAFRLRNIMIRRCRNFCGSAAMQKCLPAPCSVVPLPYHDEACVLMPKIARDQDLVFLGRLEAHKGVEDLIDALALLKERGRPPGLTVIGEGSERARLEAKVDRLELAPSVRFVGGLDERDFVPLLNRHKILVVPSRYDEPFGLVALEGIACGCFVIGSAGGGLPEAIGPCGATFPNGDVAALAEAIARFLQDPAEREARLRHAPAHLAPHRPAAVAQKYLELLASPSNLSSHPTHVESS
jgi:glycogen(starch) synthase